ncbi:MAG: GtrA family protein, partial [Thermoplasmataceae archaeon]
FSLYGRPYIIPTDVVAFVSGVALEFFLNEHWTTRNIGFHGGNSIGKLVRLFKFELLNAFGNALVIFVQFMLLVWLAIHPLIGNIIGSGLAFPLNYYLQMRSVWRVNPLE